MIKQHHDLSYPIAVIKELRKYISGPKVFNSKDYLKPLNQALTKSEENLQAISKPEDFAKQAKTLTNLAKEFTGKDIFDLSNPLFNTIFQIINVLASSGNRTSTVRDGYIARELTRLGEINTREYLPMKPEQYSYYSDWLKKKPKEVSSWIAERIEKIHEGHVLGYSQAQAEIIVFGD